MKIGDKIKFKFAKKDKEATIVDLYEKTVYLRVDFPKQKGKLVLRKRDDIKAV